MLTDSQAWNTRGDFLEGAAVGMARLEVERVHLARSAGHPEQHAVPLASRICRRRPCQPRHPAAIAESRRAEGDRAEKVAPGEWQHKTPFGAGLARVRRMAGYPNSDEFGYGLVVQHELRTIQQ